VSLQGISGFCLVQVPEIHRPLQFANPRAPSGAEVKAHEQAQEWELERAEAAGWSEPQ
jgi:hypothetical protein